MFILFALLLMLVALGTLDEMRYADEQQINRPSLQQHQAVQIDATRRYDSTHDWTR